MIGRCSTAKTYIYIYVHISRVGTECASHRDTHKRRIYYKSNTVLETYILLGGIYIYILRAYGRMIIIVVKST